MRNLYKQFNRLNINENIKPLPVSEFEKKSVKAAVMRKKKKKHYLKNTAVAAILLCASTITLSLTNPAFAQKIPFIGNVFSLFNENDEQVKRYNDFASEIGVTKESSGINITISDAAYHGETITISYLVESERDLSHIEPIFGKIYLDGLDVNLSEENHIEKLSNNKYAGLKIIKLTNSLMSESIHVNMKVQDVQFNDYDYYNNGKWSYVDGDWSFDFTLQSIESITNNYLNHRSSEKGIEVVLEKTTTTPISTNFHLNTYIDEELGNKGEHLFVDYLISDNLGNNYKTFLDETYHMGVNKKQHGLTTFAFNEDATSVTITPLVKIYKMVGDIGEKIDEFTIKPIEITLP